MELREWKDNNGNKINTPSSPAQSNTTNNTSSGFRSRLKKLATYAYRFKSNNVDSVDIIKLADDEIKFVKYYKAGNTVEYEIYIGATTEAWNLKIYTTSLSSMLL